MARSPSHKFGQIIGDLLEAAIRQPLQEIADEYDLYLDFKHSRPARNGRKKVAWRDKLGNIHDLDYVLERGGSETTQGQPIAFIEIAWRRYTKHSRNKAQEIQGAVVPLAETYGDCHPFLGAVLAGDFTDPSLDQLRSHQFTVLYFPRETVLKAFEAIGMNAAFVEGTTRADLQEKIDAFGQLTSEQKNTIATTLRELKKDDIDTFLRSLRTSLGREIDVVYIIPLHGSRAELHSVVDAIEYLTNYKDIKTPHPFLKYELVVRYTNQDEIRGSFQDKNAAVAFLKKIEQDEPPS